METREPKIKIHSPIAEHGQVWAIPKIAHQPAVYGLSADTLFKKWLIKFFKLGV